MYVYPSDADIFSALLSLKVEISLHLQAIVCCDSAMFCSQVCLVFGPNLCTCSAFNKHLWPTKSVGYFAQRSKLFFPLNWSN